ncbi:MAG: hypothetical protein SPK07_00475, partial [Coriobacteriales bacterium]|nr:hypothetical protein [Coriobacteriales bacterium]
MTDCPSSADDSWVPESPASSDDLTTSDAASEGGFSTPDDAVSVADPAASDGTASPDVPHGLPFCWWHYAIKAAAVVALLFLFSRVAAWAPGWCVAVVWAACSVLLAVGITYHAVVKKTINQAALHAGGMLGRINGGRTFRLIAAFIVSAVGVAGLLVASVGW